MAKAKKQKDLDPKARSRNVRGGQQLPTDTPGVNHVGRKTKLEQKSGVDPSGAAQNPKRALKSLP